MPRVDRGGTCAAAGAAGGVLSILPPRRFAGYPKLLVVSPKSTVGWNRGLTEIFQNQLWDGIVGYSIKKW